jgi:hypothetical protein
MKIEWYGHACFQIEGDRVSIVTDPYTPEVAGLDPVEWPVNVVIMSSATDRFHSKAAMMARKTYRELPGKRFITEVRGVSRALEASISFGDRRQRYVRWRRAS